MKLFEKTLTSETKFEGRIIKVLRDTVELENGKTRAREGVCHNGGVCVAALTEQNEVLLVRQFRYPYKEVLLELPAGKLEKGEKVVVVEDLISTGGSVLEVVDVLREAGAEVLGIVSIFTYGMKKGVERLQSAGVKNVSLCDFDTIAKVAAEENYIRPQDVQRLIAFRNNPADESWIKA